MAILEDTRVITGGVDTHAGMHVAAALDPLGGACPRPEDRPPPVTDLVSRQSSYPCGQAGMTHREERNVR